MSVEDNETLPKMSVEDNETLPKMSVEDNETLPKMSVQVNETLPKVSSQVNETLPEMNSQVKEILSNETLPKMSAQVNEAYLNGYKYPDDYIQIYIGQTKALIIECKLTLALSSPVFTAMLYGELATPGPIEVPDIEIEAFRTMLEFMNGKAVSFVNSDHAANVCYAADKYDLPELKQLCAEYLFPVNVDEMWIALECGVMFNIKSLTDAALEIQRKHSAHILSSKHLLQLPKEILSTVIQDDYLFVNNEVEILQAVVYWAKHQCCIAEKPRTQANQREVIGNVVQHIRFLTMDKMDIITIGKEILTKEEIENILKCLRKETVELNFLCSSVEERKKYVECGAYLSNLVCSINFVSSTKYSTVLSNNIEGQKLDSTCSIYLVSVTVLCRYQGNKFDKKQYFENLLVVLKENGSVIASGKYLGKAYYNGNVRIPLKTNNGNSPLVCGRGNGRTYEITIKPEIKCSVLYQMEWCNFSIGTTFKYMAESYSHIISIEYYYQ